MNILKENIRHKYPIGTVPMGYLSYFLSTKSFLVYFHPTFCPGNPILYNNKVSFTTISRHLIQQQGYFRRVQCPLISVHFICAIRRTNYRQVLCHGLYFQQFAYRHVRQQRIAHKRKQGGPAVGRPVLFQSVTDYSAASGSRITTR